MRRNVGSADRVIRILLGIVIIVAGIITGRWWGIIGILPLATGVIGWCGLYRLFGFRTNAPK